LLFPINSLSLPPLKSNKNMDAILSFFLEQFTTIALVAIGIYVIGRLIWFIAKFYFVRYKNIEHKINNVPCNSERGNCENINLMFNTLNTMAEDIKGIRYYIIRRDSVGIDELSKKCCPFQLTDVGWLLLEDSGGKKCIDDNIIFFFDEIKKMQPKVELDVENCSLSILSETINKDIFNEIKNFIFHAPSPYTKYRNGEELSIKSPITTNSVLYVMSIYLRDKFLKQYPEYNTSIVSEEEKNCPSGNFPNSSQ